MSLARKANSFLIAARARNGVIGNKGSIPWRAPHDLKHFAAQTRGTVVIMGRATWDSLPGRLPDRTNVVITSRPLTHPGVVVVGSFEEALAAGLELDCPKNAIAFIGGASVYRQALELPWLAHAHITEVDVEPEGDTFLPELGPEWSQRYAVQSRPALQPRCNFREFVRREALPQLEVAA